MDVSDTHRLMKDETPDHDRGFVSRTGDDYEAEQGPDYFPAISAETVGSKVLWFGRIVLPPGGRTKAHLHQHHETAHYMLSGGEAEMWSGSSLQHFEMVRPGDYVFIPANVLHLAERSRRYSSQPATNRQLRRALCSIRSSTHESLDTPARLNLGSALRAEELSNR